MFGARLRSSRTRGSSVKERQILDERYVIVRPLGSGSVGSLYEAENLLLGKRVAVKWINPAMARRPGVAERVTAKAKEAAGLDHPNIASVLDFGEIDGAPYIVTEQLSGVRWSARSTRAAPRTWPLPVT